MGFAMLNRSYALLGEKAPDELRRQVLRLDDRTAGVTILFILLFALVPGFSRMLSYLQPT